MMKLVLASLFVSLSLQAHTPFSSRISDHYRASSHHGSSQSSHHGSSFSGPRSSQGHSSIPFVSHGSSYTAARQSQSSHGSSYSASPPHVSPGSSYSAPVSSYSAPVSSYSAPISSYSAPVSSYSAPSIPVVSYSQPVQQYRSEPGPGVVCKNVTERKCTPKLKLEKTAVGQIVKKDVFMDVSEQESGINEVFVPEEEDMVFNTTQAVPFPVNRTVKNIFYKEVPDVITVSVDVVIPSQEPPTTQSVRVPGFQWVCPPGDDGINYQTTFIQLLPNPLQDGTRNVLNLTIPAGLKDCIRQPETGNIDITIPGETSFQIVQEPRTVNVKQLMRREDPFTIFEILYKPESVPKRELVRKFINLSKFVTVDLTKQVKKKEVETVSVEKMNFVNDTNCEEITVEKCLPVPLLNPSHSGHHRGSFSSPNLFSNNQGSRSFHGSDGSIYHPGPKVHQGVHHDNRRVRFVKS